MANTRKYALKVKQGPVRDHCTRAHGKLVTPLHFAN